MRLVVFERGIEGEGAPASGPGRQPSMGAAVLGYENLDAVTYGHRRVGAMLEEPRGNSAVVDLNRALAVKLAAEDGGAPEAAADALLPADIAHYLRRLPDSASAAREALRFVLEAQAGYDPPDFGAARILLPRRAVRLAAPIPRPGKVVAVSADGEPFLVAPSAVAGPEDDLHAPPGLALGVAPALAAVIGHTARDVAAEEAPSVVAGYAAAVSFRASGELARDLPHSGDGFLPLGPAIVSPDEAPDPCDLRMEIRVSGRSLGTSHSKEYPLQLPELIARTSRRMTLEPGDLLLVGPTTHQAEALRDGDVVEARAERIGHLAVYVRRKSAPTP